MRADWEATSRIISFARRKAGREFYSSPTESKPLPISQVEGVMKSLDETTWDAVRGSPPRENL